MAVGQFANNVLKFTSGIVSEIDPKSTMKFLGKENFQNLSKTSGAFNVGKNAANFLGGGIRDTVKGMSVAGGKKGFVNAVKSAHKETVKITDAAVAKQLGKKVGETTSAYSAKKIAGTAIGLGVAGRVVTGGGLYKDANGNFNLPGVPFL